MAIYTVRRLKEKFGIWDLRVEAWITGWWYPNQREALSQIEVTLRDYGDEHNWYYSEMNFETGLEIARWKGMDRNNRRIEYDQMGREIVR